MKALLLVALLVSIPVSAHAITFPVSVEVLVSIDGTVTLSDDREVEIDWGGSLTGTGVARIEPGQFIPLFQSLAFDATAPGGLSASVSLISQDVDGHLSGFTTLTFSTPDGQFSFDRFGPGPQGLEVSPEGAFFAVFLTSEGDIVIGSESGPFVGFASFIGSATAIPEPSVMFLMLAAGLLMTTTAVFRRSV